MHMISPRQMRKKCFRSIQKIHKLRKEIRTIKEQKIRLKKKVIHLKNIVINLKRNKLINDDVEDVLNKTFSGTPLALMKRMLGNAKRSKITREKYPETLRSFAMTLQFYSSKAYNYVRKIFDLALPSPSVIRSWMSNIHCEPGFTQQAFVTLKAKVKENEEKGYKTVCSLMLDEMSIRKQIDFASDKTWGYVNSDELEEAKEALVLRVVAVNGHWKMPIAYFFIKANIVKEALVMLKECNIHITSVTCDGPTVNFAMMQKLGAAIDNVEESMLKVYFEHPVDRSKVFVVFDVCHMIKILRNNWATMKHFKDPEGNVVNFAYIHYLYDLQETEHLRFGTKLRKAHMEWEKQKMKVNLAVQTFSRSVADALEFLMIDLKHPLFHGAAPTIKFIRLVDCLFDLLNSRSIIGKGYKTPIRKENRNIWDPIFKEALHFFRNCKGIDNVILTNTRRKTPFKGFIIAIKSITGIYEMYIETNYLKYLLTYKLSQDHLELFFCSVRSRNGWNNNPSALQFYYTYKRLLLHHDIKNITGNCIGQDTTNVLYATDSQKIIIPITSDDITIIKKYNLETDDQIINDHDYVLPINPSLTILVENVVAYIGGYVVKMAKRFVKCPKCVEALEDQGGSEEDTSTLLIRRKKRGNLIVPSKDVRYICFVVEKQLRKVFNITNQKMPNDANFMNVFIQKI